MKTIRVRAESKDELKQIRLGKTYTETVAALAGRYLQTGIVSTATGDRERHETTTIRISDDCHAVLEDMKGDMSFSDFVALCIEHWRV